MPKIKALVIGCGNIGAGYDLHQPDMIHTHAKAFSKYRNVTLVVADADPRKAEAVADHYKAKAVDLNNINFKEYAIVSIATPTATHFHYLRELLSLNIPVVICEKPVGGNSKELASLKRKYSISKSKIIVNYMRRFLPGTSVLKTRIQKIRKKEKLSAVTIRYNRGLLNNGTHAIDLLEFLFDAEFKFERFKLKAVMQGAFDGDPTVIGTCRFENAIVHLAGTDEAVFEIELLFQNTKILIGDRGNTIRYFQSKKKDTFEENLRLQQTNLLTTYMKPVIVKALAVQKSRKEKDNFLQALTLNERTLKLINTLEQ